MRLRNVSPPSRLYGTAALLTAALAVVSSYGEAQSPARKTVRSPVVAVLPFTFYDDARQSDTTAIEHGIASLLETQLILGKRLRVAPNDRRAKTVAVLTTTAAAVSAARARGASYAVLGEVSFLADTIRVNARVLRARDTLSRGIDELTATLDQIPTLVEDLADAVADSIAPRRDPTRGGPLFRPPRPSVPFAAMTLYSKAVKARAVGDADTAVRLLRQASRLAPQWEQPKRDLIALKPRP
jgi:TolB-like protein